MSTIDNLILKEGWELVNEGGKKHIVAYGEKLPYLHPAAIHLKFYRDERNPDRRYEHLKAAHDYIWPHHIKTWHKWTEDRFRAHCEEWECITLAGGSAIGKSLDAAKIAILFWLAAPRGRGVIVMSTTLESLNSRVYGYILKLLNDMKVRFPYKATGGVNPCVKMPEASSALYTIRAVAAKQGDEQKAIAPLIGRHPEKGLLIIADECTDLPMSILGAIPNLSTGVEVFQFMGIGNSSSKSDLHGALSTPKVGWENIDPMVDTKWETTQKKGVCLFFSCYNSPASYEQDPVKAMLLKKFLISKEEIEEKKKLYGPNSEAFYRFVLGYWKTGTAEENVVSKQFLDEFKVYDKCEWAGLGKLEMVAGLDPAFSVGGDKCILRLGVIGTAIDGIRVLDFRGEDLLFRVPILANSKDSIEIQIADFVIAILQKYKVPINRLCVDGSGAGRSLGEVIRLRAGTGMGPIRIYSARFGEAVTNSAFDVKVISAHELWFTFREYIQRRQIRGIDKMTAYQLYSRKVLIKQGKSILEPKMEYKARISAINPGLGGSPDEADASALCLQSAIMTMGFYPGQKQPIPQARSFVDEKYDLFNGGKRREIEQVSRELPSASFSSPVSDITKFRGGLPF